MPVLLRRYRPGDLDEMIALFSGSIRKVASRDYLPVQIEAWAEVNRAAWERKSLERLIWVAVLNQKIVGFADLEADGHLDRLFVHAAHQRVGIASLLLNTVEETAIAQGLSRIFTESSLTARPFFEKRGFKMLARQEVALRGQTFINFRMQKWL